MKTSLIGLAGMLLWPGPVYPQPPAPDAPTIGVRYGDLDLTRAEGRSTLDRRLRAGAQRVCRQHVPQSTFAPVALARCERLALANARATASLAAAEAQSRLALAESRDRRAGN